MVSDGDALGTNLIMTSENELGAKLMPSCSGGNSDSDALLMEDDSDVDWLEGPEDGDAEVAAGVKKAVKHRYSSWEYWYRPVSSRFVA